MKKLIIISLICLGLYSCSLTPAQKKLYAQMDSMMVNYSYFDTILNNSQDAYVSTYSGGIYGFTSNKNVIKRTLDTVNKADMEYDLTFRTDKFDPEIYNLPDEYHAVCEIRSKKDSDKIFINILFELLNDKYFVHSYSFGKHTLKASPPPDVGE